MPLFCPYCDIKVKSEKGLRQHINAKSNCLNKERALAGVRTNHASVAQLGKNNDLIEEHMSKDACAFRPNTRHYAAAQKEYFNLMSKAATLLDKTIQIETTLRNNASNEAAQTSDWRVSDEICGSDGTESDHDDRSGEIVYVNNEDEIPVAAWDQINPVRTHDPCEWDGVDWENDPNNDRNVNINPNTEMRREFQEYCRKARSKFFSSFSKAERRSVRLLDILKRKRAPLDTYDELMEWYHREKGDIAHFESLQHVANVDEYISRKKMLENLKDRYNMRKKFPQKVELNLPNSKASVVLTIHNAWHCIESLLTDPRVTDTDYNFFNNDPFARPPENMDVIGDLHTALAYRQAYQKYITKPRQVLLPIVMYIDGAVTGQFANLPITALKMALGIHTRSYRDKSHAWRTLGYVAQVSQAASRGKRLYRESGHIDGQNIDLKENEGVDTNKNQACKAQDYHTMLETILTSYLDVQANGFVWDLRYRGVTYTDVEFVPFVMFIKCDTDEADVLCGSYKSRTKGVAQLCRYCTCPTEETDLIRATFPKKTVKMICPLAFAEDSDSLKKLSQQMIRNAWYDVRFHPNVGQGIHGACPSEMLHAIRLGIFKYVRDCFFEKIGPTSKLADDINGLSQQFGEAFCRQSERDMPNCWFKDGIVKGKLMANEFRGILLVIAAVLRSAAGKSRLSQSKNFSNKLEVKNWALLIEMLLEWEAFLNENEMSRFHVMRLQKKNRYIMYLIKTIAPRSEGMGWKIMKFHAIVHMFLDILYFGVPKEVDTGSNESGHKETKVAAKLTQKNVATFEYQTLTRLDEFMLIDLAMHEMESGQTMCNYYHRAAQSETPRTSNDKETSETSGEPINVFRAKDKIVYSVGKGRAALLPATTKWSDDLLDFLYTLQEKLGRKLEIRSTHTREGIRFRGSPSFMSKPWRDWAMFDWGGPNKTYPGQIWCFVVIDSLDDQKTFVHRGVEVENGHYAVIENADFVKMATGTQASDIFIPIVKEVARTGHENRPWRREFWLANVEAITRPLVVIPDIGGKKGIEFFIVKQREDWVVEFKAWLERDDAEDVIGDEEPEPSCYSSVI